MSMPKYRFEFLSKKYYCIVNWRGKKWRKNCPLGFIPFSILENPTGIAFHFVFLRFGLFIDIGKRF